MSKRRNLDSLSKILLDMRFQTQTYSLKYYDFRQLIMGLLTCASYVICFYIHRDFLTGNKALSIFIQTLLVIVSGLSLLSLVFTNTHLSLSRNQLVITLRRAYFFFKVHSLVLSIKALRNLRIQERASRTQKEYVLLIKKPEKFLFQRTATKKFISRIRFYAGQAFDQRFEQSVAMIDFLENGNIELFRATDLSVVKERALRLLILGLGQYGKILFESKLLDPEFVM